jgi:hypothetical protein
MESYVADGAQVPHSARFRGLCVLAAFLLTLAAVLTIGFAAGTPGFVAPVDPGGAVQVYAPPWSVEDPTSAPAGGVR